MTAVADRFWKFVISREPGECWVWRGVRNARGGYGQIHVGPGRNQSAYAHRLSWSFVNGPIPDGLWVLHHCDNKGCVNPEHLYLGTVVDNAADAVARKRLVNAQKQSCPQGHAYDEANTYNRKVKTNRRCRTCQRIRYHAGGEALRAVIRVQKTNARLRAIFA